MCIQPEMDNAVRAELKKSQPTSSLRTVSQPPESNIDTLIDINCFSDSDKLLHVTALVPTLVDRLKKIPELSWHDVLARAKVSLADSFNCTGEVWSVFLSAKKDE